MFLLFAQGILIGLLASVPLGPAGVLCIQRTLNRGRLVGFVSGMGIALADTMFSALSVFGLSVVESWLVSHERVLQVLVGVVVMLVGVRIILTNPVKQLRANNKQQGSLWGAMASIFLLTANPANLLPVLFLVSLFKISAGDMWHATTVVFGVLIGALVWWFFISTLITHYRERFKLRQMWWINKIAGAAILFLGALAFVNGVARVVVG